MLNSSIICIGFPYLTSDLYISSETALELDFVKSIRMTHPFFVILLVLLILKAKFFMIRVYVNLSMLELSY